MDLEHSYIDTNGIRLHVVQTGPQSGPPIVLLHGFPETWRSWIRQIPVLAQAGCRLIIPEQRGYALSDKPEGVSNYKIETLACDILGLIDALGYEKVNLVGHDWGGMVAWQMGMQAPERLHRLSVLNAPHPAVMKRFLRRDFDQMRRSLYALFFQIPWLPEALLQRNNFQLLADTLQNSARAQTFSAEDLSAYREAWAQSNALTSMLNWYRAATQNMLSASEPPMIKVPTLMMWGMKDTALTHRLARPSMDYCLEGQLVFLPEATHWVQREAAEEVNRLLLGFIHS